MAFQQSMTAPTLRGGQAPSARAVCAARTAAGATAKAASLSIAMPGPSAPARLSGRGFIPVNTTCAVGTPGRAHSLSVIAMAKRRKKGRNAQAYEEDEEDKDEDAAVAAAEAAAAKAEAMAKDKAAKAAAKARIAAAKAEAAALKEVVAAMEAGRAEEAAEEAAKVVAKTPAPEASSPAGGKGDAMGKREVADDDPRAGMTPAEFLDAENARLAAREKRKAAQLAGASSVSSGVRLEGIKIAFKGEDLLTDVTWDVKKGQRVGLVGVNGAGKTTQLEIIRGKIEPDDGIVIKANSKMKIAYLSQEFDITMTNTLREEFQSAYEEAMLVNRALEETQTALEGAGEDMELMGRLLDDLDALQKKADRLDVTRIDKKIDIMMPELGFKPEDDDRLVASYSGGWQMRIQIGKMMLSDPDLVMLDEPTNHLDLEAIQWLEGYLKVQEVPMVVVSHDREFLDQVCNKIVETERGVATEFMGNYTEFMRRKDELLAQQWAAYDKQQKEIQRQQDLINRLAAGEQTGRATSAEKALERLRSPGTFIEKPFVEKRRPFRFPEVERCGQRIMSIQGLTHGYNGSMLFDNANLEVEKGERIAIQGPNGAGKSTLLRILLGREEPLQGRADMGPHNVFPNYFEQNQAEALDLSLTVLETLERAAPDAQMREIKSLLGRFMFKGDAMHKKVEWLSGGEKARLALAKFMLTPATLLILDEPTNHLDIPSKEMLEDALSEFTEGSVLAVSHDRYFLRKIATRVVEISGGQFADYQGDYDEFLEKNDDEAAKMEEKVGKAKKIEQDNIKATSKMSKAEKMKLKKEKAKQFSQGGGRKKVNKNAGRWN